MALNEINQKDLHSTIKITISKMELIGTCLQEKESLKSEERKKQASFFAVSAPFGLLSRESHIINICQEHFGSKTQA